MGGSKTAEGGLKATRTNTAPKACKSQLDQALPIGEIIRSEKQVDAQETS